jgi:hypothetical protein
MSGWDRYKAFTTASPYGFLLCAILALLSGLFQLAIHGVDVLGVVYIALAAGLFWRAWQRRNYRKLQM